MDKITIHSVRKIDGLPQLFNPTLFHLYLNPSSISSSTRMTLESTRSASFYQHHFADYGVKPKPLQRTHILASINGKKICS